MRGHVLSFVPAQHILDGIHDGRIAGFVAIVVKLLLILFDCFGFDDSCRCVCRGNTR
jgi:hypothetical protein